MYLDKGVAFLTVWILGAELRQFSGNFLGE